MPRPAVWEKAAFYSAILSVLIKGGVRFQSPTWRSKRSGCYPTRWDCDSKMRSSDMQIPTDAGQIFRGDAGRDSDLKPDAIPR